MPNELLLDVADYKHIVDGLLLLVGHEADYVVDDRRLGPDSCTYASVTPDQILSDARHDIVSGAERCKVDGE